MTRRTILHMQDALVIVGVIIVFCLAGCKASEPKKLSIEETEAITKQIDDATEELAPFIPQRIWKAHQVIRNILDRRDLRESDPRLAARAHRVMAGIYFAANTCVAPANSDVEIAVHKLGQNGWRNAAQELEESLRLDPSQTGASDIRATLQILKEEKMPLDQFDKLIGLLIVSLRNEPKKQ